MKSENLFVKQIQRTIRNIKESREMECRYQFQGDMLYREYKRGKLEATKETTLKILKKFGSVSESLYNRIMSENDIVVLDEIVEIAVNAESLEQFEERILNL